MSITYTPIYSRHTSYEVDSSEGNTVGDCTKLVTLKQVSSVTPLVGASSVCNGTRHALYRALVTLKNHGCTSARYYNVEDSHMQSLHIEVSDGEGNLPWSYVIENGVLVSVADGLVVKEATTVDLTDLDTSMGRALH